MGKTHSLSWSKGWMIARLLSHPRKLMLLATVGEMWGYDDKRTTYHVSSIHVTHSPALLDRHMFCQAVDGTDSCSLWQQGQNMLASVCPALFLAIPPLQVYQGGHVLCLHRHVLPWQDGYIRSLLLRKRSPAPHWCCTAAQEAVGIKLKKLVVGHVQSWAHIPLIEPAVENLSKIFSHSKSS